MRRTLLTASEEETRSVGAKLAVELYANRPAFVSLKGELGAGKTSFARGFIEAWCRLAGDPAPQGIVSPTYNIVKVYGTAEPIAHLDLYRVKSSRELEQLGFEHYFFEHSCCVVEWLGHIPEAAAAAPTTMTVVQINFDPSRPRSGRVIEIIRAGASKKDSTSQRESS